jgi:hypothetical protein
MLAELRPHHFTNRMTREKENRRNPMSSKMKIENA